MKTQNTNKVNQANIFEPLKQAGKIYAMYAELPWQSILAHSAEREPAAVHALPNTKKREVVGGSEIPPRKLKREKLTSRL